MAQIQINNEGVVTGWSTLGGFENGVEVENLPNDIETQNYRYVNGEFIKLPTSRGVTVENSERVAELKYKLHQDDYKIIKCAEAMITGVAMPYDINSLVAERNEIREEINSLEEV